MIYDRNNRKYIEEQTNSALSLLYNNVIGRIFLLLLTRRWMSNIGSLYLKSSLSKHRIMRMIKTYKIDLNEYEKKEYQSFNQFFMRKKKNPQKMLTKTQKAFVAPAESLLTVYRIDDDTCLNIKNSKYTIEELLRDKKLATKYKGGYCFIYRLCVNNYHYYYYVDNADVISTKKIDGVLHTVQPIAFKKYKVFSENSREYSILKTDNFGTIVQMEIGAMLVGKICNNNVKKVKRGEEKGHFEFGGSTVVVLVEKDKVKVDDDILENSAKDIETKVSLFETVGRKM